MFHNDFNFFNFPHSGKLITSDEGIKAINMTINKGSEYFQKTNAILAYDESINKFSALEGTAYLTSHSLVIHNKNDYLPLNLIEFYLPVYQIFLLPCNNL